MRTLAIACVLFAVGCIRDNPDFSSAQAPGPLPGTSNGPPISDLATTPTPTHDLGSAPVPTMNPDLSMSFPGPGPGGFDLGPGPGGGMGDPDPGVACGMQTCASPNVCCAALLGPSCVAANAMCLGGKNMACDGPEDCENGDTCCDGVFGSTCQKQCNGDQLCHTQDDCQNGEKCCPALLGYPVCRKFGC